MALGLTESLKEMSTRNVSLGRGLTLSPSCADCLEISTSWSPQGLSRPVMGLLCFMAQMTGYAYNTNKVSIFKKTATPIPVEF
jgi:hypothetical protein